MPRIAHLSDIHVRGSTRLAEYREVFEKCFAQLRALSPDLIFIGGDIVHSKTQGITPELIDFLVWWFRSLADIAPTHVTLGNHDGILTNDDRQDAISPIVTALNDPRITLYKKSGVYSTGIPGFNWCVFSCFDEAGWKNVKPVPDDVNIATFHGAVWGSMTDIDWKIEGEIDTSFFDGYDFCMLGDIHKMQFLGQRATINGLKPHIAYSGDVIQQNYGESLDKGFLLWDIRSRDDFDVEFHAVSSVNPFVTIDWQGSMSATLDAVKNLPERARIRIRSQDPIPAVEWKHISSELSQRLQAVEVVSQPSRDFDVKKITANDIEMSKDDLRDPETQHRLLRSYLKNASLDDNDWQEIESIVTDKLQSLSKMDDFSRGKHWSLRRLEFDNTFSYGEGNVIDFEKKSGITGIFGRNAIGKSSIMGTMMYALFNATDRGAIRNIDVVNTRKMHCLTKATVVVDGERYRLERQTMKHKEKGGTDGALTSLNVFHVDDNDLVLEDRSGEQRKDTDKVLRKKLGLADDFLLTSFASQGEMNTFVRQKNTARKAVLTKILGLDVFDQMHSMVREEAKIVQGQMRNFPDQHWERLIDEKKKEIFAHEQTISQLEREAENLRDEERSLRVELSGVSADLITQDDVVKQQHVIEQMEKKQRELKLQIVEIEKNLALLEEKQTKIARLKSSISIDDLREKLSSLRQREKTHVELKHNLEREKTTLKHQEKAVERLSEVPCGDLFPTCKFISESHACKSKILTQKEKIDRLAQDIIEIEQNATDSIESVEEQIRKYEAVLRSETEVKAAVTVKSAQRLHLDNDVKKGVEHLDTAQSQLASLESRVVSSALGNDVAAKRKLLELKVKPL